MKQDDSSFSAASG